MYEMSYEKKDDIYLIQFVISRIKKSWTGISVHVL